MTGTFACRAASASASVRPVTTSPRGTGTPGRAGTGACAPRTHASRPGRRRGYRARPRSPGTAGCPRPRRPGRQGSRAGSTGSGTSRRTVRVVGDDDAVGALAVADLAELCQLGRRHEPLDVGDRGVWADPDEVRRGQLQHPVAVADVGRSGLDDEAAVG